MWLVADSFCGRVMKNRKKLVELGELCLAGVLLFIFYRRIGCPIKVMTGVSCAGCGMTRAWIALLQLHWRDAFEYHPLVLLPIVFVVAFILKQYGHERLFRRTVAVLVVLFCIVYVMRMLDPSDNIVVFRPKDGYFYRIGMKFYYLGKSIFDLIRN